MFRFEDLAKKYERAAEVYPRKLEAVVEQVVSRVVERVRNERFNGTTSSSLESRSGTLKDSIHHKVESQGLFIVGSVGTGFVPYGAIQDLGGTVGAKPGSALTVPTQTAKSLVVNPRASDFQGLFKIVRQGKPPLLARRSGSDLQVLFVLKDQVTLPSGRLGLKKVFAEEVRSDKFREEVEGVLKEALGG